MPFQIPVEPVQPLLGKLLITAVPQKEANLAGVVKF
jgi:hypothetical protein